MIDEPLQRSQSHGQAHLLHPDQWPGCLGPVIAINREHFPGNGRHQSRLEGGTLPTPHPKVQGSAPASRFITTSPGHRRNDTLCSVPFSLTACHLVLASSRLSTPGVRVLLLSLSEFVTLSSTAVVVQVILHHRGDCPMQYALWDV